MTASIMIAMAVARRHLSSARQLFMYLLIVRHSSDSRVFCLHDLTFSFRYRRLLETSFSKLRSSLVESGVIVEADDGEGDGEGEGEGDVDEAENVGIDITCSSLGIFGLEVAVPSYCIQESKIEMRLIDS